MFLFAVCLFVVCVAVDTCVSLSPAGIPTVVVSTDASLAPVVASTSPSTLGLLKWDVTGLTADTQYYYGIPGEAPLCCPAPRRASASLVLVSLPRAVGSR